MNKGSGQKDGSRDELVTRRTRFKGSRGRNSRKEKAEEPELWRIQRIIRNMPVRDEYQDSDEYG